MKKTLAFLSAICAVSTLTLQTQAAAFYGDTFSYGNGALTNVSSPLWQAHSGGGSTAVQVSSGQISLVQGSGTREDVNRPTGVTMGAGETWYAGFDVAVSGGTTTVYFAHFLQGTSNFGSRIYVTNSAVLGGDFSFGIGSAASPAATWASPLTFNTTYRLLVSYEYDTGVGRLWINPTQESDTSISAPGFASNAMIAFAFRQAGGNSVQTIDNLVVGTSFNDVLTIPEPSSLALGALGFAALVAARRRKA
jgi:MYXO-CTERM domain-containing protein